MSVTLSPIGGAGAQFFDNNGDPLSGGKFYTYRAGTSTPQATYTSSTGTTAHTNPIILDSAGRVPGGEIWLTASDSYKFVLKTSADVLIATYDNITGTSFATNARFVTYDPPFPNVVEQTVSNKLQEWVSVKDFGAIGDGVADDRLAIQNCLNYCNSAGKCVFIPNGTYKVLDSLILYDYQVIRGQGWRKTMITGVLGNKSIIRTQYGENPTYAQRTIGWDIGEFSVTNTGGAGSIGLNFGNVGYSNVINMGVYNAETGLKCTQRTYYTCFINLSCQANLVCADLQSDGGANEFINANFGFGGGVGNAGVKITSGSWKFNGGTVDTNSADAGWFFKVGENGYPLTASLQISNVYVEGSTSAQNVLHFYDNTITTNIFGMERRGSLGPVVYENTAIYDGIYMDSASQPNPSGQFTRRVAFTRNPGTGIIDGGLVALEGGTLKVVAQNLTATGSLSLFNLYLNGGGATGAGLYFSTTNPEGVITAAAGSLCIVNTTGGGGSVGATYKKTGGTGNIGWVAI